MTKSLRDARKAAGLCTRCGKVKVSRKKRKPGEQKGQAYAQCRDCRHERTRREREHKTAQAELYEGIGSLYVIPAGPEPEPEPASAWATHKSKISVMRGRKRSDRRFFAGSARHSRNGQLVVWSPQRKPL